MGTKYIIKVSVTDRPDDQGAIGATSDNNSKSRSFTLQEKLDPQLVEQTVGKAMEGLVVKLSKAGTLFENEEPAGKGRDA